MSIRRYAKKLLASVQLGNNAIYKILSRQLFKNSGIFLQIGTGNRAQQKLLSRLAADVPPRVWAIEDTSDRIAELKRSLPGGSTILCSNPIAAQLPDNVSLCVIATEASRIPDVVEELLYERLPPALAEGAIVVLLFCRDASTAALTRAGVFGSVDRDALKLFLEEHFGIPRIGQKELEKRFAICPLYEFVDWEPSARGNPDQSSIVWIALRKRPAKAESIVHRSAKSEIAFPRSERTDQYRLKDFELLLTDLVRAKIAFKTTEEFSSMTPATKGAGLLKFDIHGNMRRPVEMAKILTSLHIPGLFLMMPRNPINEDFFGNSETWERLREIRELGHEIGLHPDVFFLIRRYGDLYKGLEASVTEFSKRGFSIRSATVHGDTRAHIKECKMQANDFFAEKYRRTKWNGHPPKGEEILAEHVFKYSYKKIAADFGIRFFPEINFVADGELVEAGVQAYLTDNSRSFELRGTKDGRHKIRSSIPFRLTPRFARECVNELRTKRFLALFHPQWYW